MAGSVLAVLVVDAPFLVSIAKHLDTVKRNGQRLSFKRRVLNDEELT
jgi:hypothetical protein